MSEEQKKLETTFQETTRTREAETLTDQEIVSSEVSVTIVEDAEIVQDKSFRKLDGRSRNRVITAELVRTIADNVALGLSIKNAAKASGASADSVDTWYHRGSQGDESASGLYVALFRAITEAKSQAQARYARVIQRCAESDDERISLAAATWWLERRAPETWAKKDMSKVEVKDVTEKLTDSDLESKIRKLAAARGWK